MRLAGIFPGDEVRCRVRGIEFPAIVEKVRQGELEVDPLNRNISFRVITARQVTERLRRHGRLIEVGAANPGSVRGNTARMPVPCGALEVGDADLGQAVPLFEIGTAGTNHEGLISPSVAPARGVDLGQEGAL